MPGDMMSIGDKFFSWIATVYPLDKFFFWGIVASICLLLYIEERVRPAEPNQSFRSMVTNGRITLVYAIFSPIALFGANFLVGYFIAAAVNRFLGPWFVFDSSGLASGHSELVRMILLAPFIFVP
jgi:hypothetical protein